MGVLSRGKPPPKARHRWTSCRFGNSGRLFESIGGGTCRAFSRHDAFSCYMKGGLKSLKGLRLLEGDFKGLEREVQGLEGGLQGLEGGS